MNCKSLICLLLTIQLVLPAQCWAQIPPSGMGQTPEERNKLEKQAQIYLQRVGPQPVIPGQMPPQLPQQQPSIEQPSTKVPTEAPRQLEETSAAELRARANGLNVKQFGYSFFYKPPETFLPVQSVPVGPDYLIGPGDTIKILVWGNVQGEYSLTVDRNGQINIPKVGVVHVSGLSYRQLREVIDREFSRLFTNFQMNVTLDNLRTIQIYVVGQARFPGSYAVSSLSTLISALFAAGGPSKTGSLRDIQVRRGKRVVVHFDMYDFLLRGDKSKDIRLQPEDVIFIPPIGPLVAIGAPSRETVGLAAEEGKPERVGIIEEGKKIRRFSQTPTSGGAEARFPGGAEARFPRGAEGAFPGGAEGAATAGREELPTGPPPIGGPIKVPGIYELRNERTLTDLIKLTGGLGGTAFKGRVQVRRIEHHRETVLFEDDLNKVMTGKVRDISLVDGDLITIFRVPEVVEKKVRLAGAVKKPGEFGFYGNMRVKDLIEYGGGLLMEANQQEAEITRVTITPEGPETSRLYISPRLALSGSPRDNILLRPNDYLFIRSIPDWSLYSMATIQGEVKFPGTYAIKKGETLSSLLVRAGGFTNRAYIKGAFFTRESVKRLQAENLKQITDRLEAELLASSAAQTQTSLDKDEVERQKMVVAQQQQLIATMRTIVPLGRVVIHLDDPERLRGTPDDLELQNNDNVTVPQIQQTVSVLGSVVNPTAVVYSPYLTVNDYISKVGGPSKNADVSQTYVIKVNGAALGNSGFFFGGVGSSRLDPGDTIVVPENLEKIAWLKEIKDITTILGQIALTAGVVLVGLKR